MYLVLLDAFSRGAKKSTYLLCSCNFMPKHSPKNVVGVLMPWEAGTLAISLLVAVASGQWPVGISSMLKTFVDIPVTRKFHPKVSLLHIGSKLSFKQKIVVVAASARVMEKEMGESVIRKAEELVISAMKGNDASHDAAHAFRVRDLALSLAQEEGLSSSPEAMEIVELAALLHDIGDYKYVRDPSEERIVERFLESESVEENKKRRILSIIKGMGFKEELACDTTANSSAEFKVVQDADRLDAIGAIGIARCFTFGGSRNRVLHDPNIKPRLDLSKEQYMKKDEQTTINHFHEKLFKLKDLMKTEAGQRRAEKRHNVMEDFIKEFYEEWDGRS